jgi:RimJ/RimL family protein N-acetyltransferase
VLRPVVVEDLPALFEFQFDPIANRMAAFPAREHDEFMVHWRKLLVDPAVLLRAIVVDSAMVGNVTAWDEHERRLVGYWIGRPHWGKGYASAALSQFLSIENRRPLHAFVAQHNVASVRILRKCGFVVIGESKGPSETPGVEVDDFLMELP